jgi:hypothetical protein
MTLQDVKKAAQTASYSVETMDIMMVGSKVVTMDDVKVYLSADWLADLKDGPADANSVLR